MVLSPFVSSGMVKKYAGLHVKVVKLMANEHCFVSTLLNMVRTSPESELGVTELVNRQSTCKLSALEKEKRSNYFFHLILNFAIEKSK